MVLLIRRTLLAAVLIAVAVAAFLYTPPVAADSSCSTGNASLVATIDAKIERHKQTGRTDLVETFTRARDTMCGDDDYTVSDLKARPDRQTANWQGDGPNALWQEVYAELDRQQEARATADTVPTPVPTPAPTPTPTPQDDPPPAAEEPEPEEDSEPQFPGFGDPPPEEGALITPVSDDPCDGAGDLPCVWLENRGELVDGRGFYTIVASKKASAYLYLDVTYSDGTVKSANFPLVATRIGRSIPLNGDDFVVVTLKEDRAPTDRYFVATGWTKHTVIYARGSQSHLQGDSGAQNCISYPGPTKARTITQGSSTVVVQVPLEAGDVRPAFNKAIGTPVDCASAGGQGATVTYKVPADSPGSQAGQEFCVVEPKVSDYPKRWSCTDVGAVNTVVPGFN